MLQTSTSPAVQKAVTAQVAKSAYQRPMVVSLKLESAGNAGPLAFAGNNI